MFFSEKFNFCVICVFLKERFREDFSKIEILIEK